VHEEHTSALLWRYCRAARAKRFGQRTVIDEIALPKRVNSSVQSSSLPTDQVVTGICRRVRALVYLGNDCEIVNAAGVAQIALDRSLAETHKACRRRRLTSALNSMSPSNGAASVPVNNSAAKSAYPSPKPRGAPRAAAVTVPPFKRRRSLASAFDGGASLGGETGAEEETSVAGAKSPFASFIVYPSLCPAFSMHKGPLSPTWQCVSVGARIAGTGVHPNVNDEVVSILGGSDCRHSILTLLVGIWQPRRASMKAGNGAENTSVCDGDEQR
jgi:hypothetical protein